MLRLMVMLYVALSCVGSVSAQESGKEVFGKHCAACHGVDAVGNGPVAENIDKQVPDLTLLAKANGGAFPMLQVIHVIDGRTGLRGHGGEMPVFGNVFRMDFGKYGVEVAEMESLARILSIAYYLESVQK